MVAISLYRGNLHRVPSDPRRWVNPRPRFSLNDFRKLLHRRSKALSLLNPSAFASSSTPADAAAVPNSNPAICLTAPLAQAKQDPEQQEQLQVHLPVEPVKLEACSAVKVETDVMDAIMEDQKGNEGEKCDGELLNQSVQLIACEIEVEEMASDAVEGHGAGNAAALQSEKEKSPLMEDKEPEGIEKEEALDEKEKRQKEVEEKLQILNAKKHNLVQALKQILSAEEELKRRSSTQAIRPSLPQVDATTDSGSIIRLATPITVLEANVGSAEGTEADDASNHNLLPFQHLSSVSPSSESALRRPASVQHTVTSLVSQPGTVAAASPSLFAHPGNQGQPSNLPTVSVSATSYVASSPSPAASGGTSAFRDAQHPSPWN